MAFALHALHLINFRNYADVRVDAAGPCHILLGPNGIGKTNILEAISLLIPGRGLRSASATDIISRNGPVGMGWAVHADVSTSFGPRTITTGSESAERRLVKIEHTSASQQELARHMALVWLTPEMDRLLAESAGTRRRFFDKLVAVFDPAHTGRLTRYEKAMRERLKILTERQGHTAWLSGIEHAMAESAVAIVAARLAFLEMLNAGAAAPHCPPFPALRFSLDGWLEDQLAINPALMVEDALKERLMAERALDAASGTTHTGPQKTLFTAYHLERGITAEQGSTGEQKIMILALILAFARVVATKRKDPPILLLDDIASHLDSGHRSALFSEVLALGGQAWFSGTEKALFAPLLDTAKIHDLNGKNSLKSVA